MEKKIKANTGRQAVTKTWKGCIILDDQLVGRVDSRFLVYHRNKLFFVTTRDSYPRGGEFLLDKHEIFGITSAKIELREPECSYD